MPRTHLLTKYIKLKEVTLKNEAKIKYKQYRNLLPTLMKESKKYCFTNYFQNNLTDLKSTWKGIKNLISLKELPNVAPSNIFDNGRSLTEPQEIANAFNKYFVNVATDIQSSIRYSKNNFHDFLPPININSFFLNPTDEIEVKNIILSLNPSKAIGPNSIPTKILKLLINDVSSQLTEFFNLSYSRRVFPLILKTSKVIPVYKKDSKLKCSNYRPISLLSNIDKVLERLMYNRLYNFLEMNSVIYDLQFGFRQKYSTSHALIHLTDKIREQLDSGNFACGIFVDLQKAFDTVDHDILIQKLNQYDIRGVANN